jgi:hypothetical protein
MEKKRLNQSPKIAVTKEADALLAASLNRINEGFLGGKVNKLDLASWAIVYALENMPDQIVEKIRKRFFNEVCYLEAVLKQTRASGQERLTTEQVAALQGILNPKPEKVRKHKEDFESSVSAE